MATIKEVAKEAGVSVATVSRVLNANGYVHEDTRKAVDAAIKKLDYRPNEIARSLYNRKSKLIGLVVSDITNPFFPELARGVEDFLQEQGYRLIIGNSDEKRDKEINYIETFIQHNVIGMISTSGEDTTLWDSIKIPVVLLDRITEDYPSVYADQAGGGRLAAKVLIDRGSTNITLLRGPQHVRTAQDRFLAALEVLGRSKAAFQVMNTSFSFKGANETAKHLFDMYPDTDGIVASNDIVASAVLREALKRGKKIPENLQIIGFDDIPVCELLYPALSTIHQPAYQMGAEAAKLLIENIIYTSSEVKQIVLPVSFKERETTRRVER
jgi:LacI family transcriptional regulator